MSVKATPLANGKFRVTIRFRWPDETVYRERPNIDAPSRAMARKWGESRETELRAKGKPLASVDVVDKPKCITVETFAPKWIDGHAKANLHKQSGIDAQESILRVHILPFIGTKRLDEITDGVRAGLQATWIAGGYLDGHGHEVKGTDRKKTINNRLSVLAKLLKTAVEWRETTGLHAMPCTVRLLKVDDQREAAFHEHDVYERLVAASAKVDVRYHATILLGGDGGLRRGEILALDLTDVDFTRGRMVVRRSVYWRKKVAIVQEVKGGKEKAVPLTPRLLEALKKVRHLRGPRVLHTDDGAPVTPKIIKAWVMTVERRAGLPETGRLHVFRHTFASHLAMAGVPAMTVKELARHSSLATTMRYMHLSPSAKDEGIAMLTKSREAGGKPVAIGTVKTG